MNISLMELYKSIFSETKPIPNFFFKSIINEKRKSFLLNKFDHRQHFIHSNSSMDISTVKVKFSQDFINAPLESARLGIS